MAKYSGKIGYAATLETEPGVFTPSIVEKQHYGDIIREAVANRKAFSINDTAVINSRLSIIMTPYMVSNAHKMKYATVDGAKIKITNWEVLRPRVIITLGGAYNG